MYTGYYFIYMHETCIHGLYQEWHQSQTLFLFTQMLNFTCFKRHDRWRDCIDTLLMMYSYCAVCWSGDLLQCISLFLIFTAGRCTVNDWHSLPRIAFCTGFGNLNMREKTFKWKLNSACSGATFFLVATHERHHTSS